MEELSVRFGAVVKETITKDNPSPFADDLKTDEIETNKIEPGAESVTTFSKKISENSSINSTIDFLIILPDLMQRMLAGTRTLPRK